MSDELDGATRDLPSSGDFPGFWQAVGLLVLYFFFIQVVVTPFFIFDKLHHTSLTRHPVVLAAAILGAGSMVLWLASRQLGVRARDIVAGVPIRRDLFIPMAATVLGQVMLEVPVMLWILRRFPALIPKDAFDSNPVWGFAILASIAAPFFEETIFRGIFLHGFVARYGSRRALLLGAALFAALHFEPVKVPGLLLNGVLWGWWFLELRSIWPGVFGHALNNSLAVLAVWADPTDAAEGTLPPFTWIERVAAAIGAVMLTWGVLVLRRKFRRRTCVQLSASHPT